MPDQSLVLMVLLHPVTAGAGFLITAVPARTQLIHLSTVDVLIIAIYFAMVLFIGFYVKRGTRTSKEFFMAGREMTAWIAGLTKPRNVRELEGLVMGATKLPTKDKCHWYQEPIFWGGVVAVVFVVLNIALW